MLATFGGLVIVLDTRVSYDLGRGVKWFWVEQLYVFLVRFSKALELPLGTDCASVGPVLRGLKSQQHETYVF